MDFNTQTQVSNLESKMMGLVKQLEKLAPHPSRPEHHGPVFVNIAAPSSSEHDGMLGSMILESMLGTAFMSAVNDSFGTAAASVDWSNAAEAASTYWQDRQSKPANSYTLGQKQSISGQFNAISDEALMQAYLRDLPRRLGLERWLAHYQRKIHALRKAGAFAPALAA